MNEKQLSSIWDKVKGQVKQQWGNLTDDEITKIDGKAEELSASLQKHYGYTKEEAEKKINEFLDKF